MNKLNIYCISLEPNHYDFIKQLGYKPVGLGEKIFNENIKMKKVNDWANKI